MNAESIGWIALIRAIGPATHKMMSMSQLRDACVAADLGMAQTVLATGNLLFRSDKPKSDLQEILAGVIAQHGLDNEVFLRNPAELAAVLAANPFPMATEKRPNHMLVLFMDSVPEAKSVAKLAMYDGPEKTRCIGKEVYIDYVNGVAGSKLTPARLEKALGQSGTARNWNTVRKLVEMTNE